MDASTELCIDVNGTEVWLQGQGDEVILMLHGWPDTRALWDGTVAALQDRAICARLTLPGFESGPSVTSLDNMCQLLRQIVDRISPDRPVTLMLHDWGCIFGYQFAMRHAERVARVVAVDVGDHNAKALLRSWSAKEKLSVMGKILLSGVTTNHGVKVGYIPSGFGTEDPTQSLGLLLP